MNNSPFSHASAALFRVDACDNREMATVRDSFVENSAAFNRVVPVIIVAVAVAEGKRS